MVTASDKIPLMHKRTAAGLLISTPSMKAAVSGQIALRVSP